MITKRKKINNYKRSQGKRAILENKKIRIVFPYDPNMVLQVRQLHGRKFNNLSAVDKFWTAPLSIDNVELIKKMDLKIDPKILEWYDKHMNQIDIKPVDVKGLHGEMFQYQKDGVAFLEAHEGRALIGDEMGLGKTLQVIAYLQLHPEFRPAIVVCPASLKLTWKREIHKWMGNNMDVLILNGKKANTVLSNNAINVINYDILSAWKTTILKSEPEIIIMDECHFIKNRKAQRTKAAIALAKKIPHLICLSGTPIINRPLEMYQAIKLIEPGLFPSFFDYAQRYCGATHNGFGWDFSGATNTEELHNKLAKTIMIRRLKTEVLKDLPPKIRTVIPLEIDNRAEYNKAIKDFNTTMRALKKNELTKDTPNLLNNMDVDDNVGTNILTHIEKLKQLTVHGKMKQALQWIDDFIDTDQKLVIFTAHKWTIDKLMDHYKDIAVKIDGSVTMDKRQKAVDEFQTNSKIRLFIGNLKAAGTGLTLTAASSTLFLELGWTPGEHDQAEDRVHRIGQEADSVNAYYLIADNTIDNDIIELLDDKRRVLVSVLDGTIVKNASTLSDLLKRMQKHSSAL